ncbi:stage II sporulation protein R [Clostridium sp.]|uniref:stage II sporulation protein R n=1 Tax=Clostridium sp. TaxID=1506 RepID=UPI0032178AA2
MKRFISIVVTIFIMFILVFEVGVVGVTNTATAQSNEKEITIEEISSKLIRFHVIANSDSEEDQALKLKVRDAVLKYVQPLLKDSKDIEESRRILKREDKKIIEIANKVVEDNSYNYCIESTLTKEYFPVKTYGNITLPQGEYEAYRIIIGTGEGQNWWCVMFPPICFVDITRGDVAYEETEEEMKRVLDDDEYNMVDNDINNEVEEVEEVEESEESEEIEHDTNKEVDKKDDSNIVDNSEDDNIVIKFKIVDVLKTLFK